MSGFTPGNLYLVEICALSGLRALYRFVFLHGGHGQHVCAGGFLSRIQRWFRESFVWPWWPCTSALDMLFFFPVPDCLSADDRTSPLLTLPMLLFFSIPVAFCPTPVDDAPYSESTVTEGHAEMPLAPRSSRHFVAHFRIIHTRIRYTRRFYVITFSMKYIVRVYRTFKMDLNGWTVDCCTVVGLHGLIYGLLGVYLHVHCVMAINVWSLKWTYNRWERGTHHCSSRAMRKSCALVSRCSRMCGTFYTRIWVGAIIRTMLEAFGR